MQSVSLTSRTCITLQVMVATIVFGEQDGSLITGLRVKLTEVAEALYKYTQIGGPLNWHGRGVNNILNSIQSTICSLDKRLHGSWVSVFVRLGPKGKKQMLLNTETRNVSICIVLIRTDVSVKLTIFDDIPQFVMQALVNTKEHAMERYPRIPQGGGWQSIFYVNWPRRRT